MFKNWKKVIALKAWKRKSNWFEKNVFKLVSIKKWKYNLLVAAAFLYKLQDDTIYKLFLLGDKPVDSSLYWWNYMEFCELNIHYCEDVICERNGSETAWMIYPPDFLLLFFLETHLLTTPSISGTKQLAWNVII